MPRLRAPCPKRMGHGRARLILIGRHVMSNAICIQDQCQTFLMYNKVAAGDPATSGGGAFVPYIKTICQSADGYIVSDFNLEGTPYSDAVHEEADLVG